MSQPPANRYIVSEFYRSYRLDRYLQAMIPKLSRARIQDAIRTRVTVSWHPAPRPSLVVVPGGEVAIHFPEIVEPPVPALPGVLHEDDAILVVNKPAGLLVHPTHSCRLNSLIHLVRAERPGVPLALAHRLDRDTSGLIVLTKTLDAARTLAGMFERREVEKEYLAAATGVISPPAGRIDAELGVTQHLQVIFKRSVGGRQAQRAVTDYEVLATGRGACLVRLSPRTGRRHQLRAHLAAIGHPIAGDKLYSLPDREFLKHLRELQRAEKTRGTAASVSGDAALEGEQAGGTHAAQRTAGSPPAERSTARSAAPAGVDSARAPAADSAAPADRQLLHAWRLSFAHPASGERVRFEAPIPDDMRDYLEARGITVPGE